MKTSKVKIHRIAVSFTVSFIISLLFTQCRQETIQPFHPNKALSQKSAPRSAAPLGGEHAPQRLSPHDPLVRQTLQALHSRTKELKKATQRGLNFDRLNTQAITHRIISDSLTLVFIPFLDRRKGYDMTLESWVFQARPPAKAPHFLFFIRENTPASVGLQAGESYHMQFYNLDFSKKLVKKIIRVKKGAACGSLPSEPKCQALLMKYYRLASLYERMLAIPYRVQLSQFYPFGAIYSPSLERERERARSAYCDALSDYLSDLRSYTGRLNYSYFEGRYTDVRPGDPVPSPRGAPTLRGDGSYNQGGWRYGKTRSGGKKDHYGIDLQSPVGGKLHSMYEGRVVHRGFHKDLGNFIDIESTVKGQTLRFRYAHLSTISVANGAAVSQTQVIGTTGKTGNAIKTGIIPHVHIAVSRKVNGKWWDKDNGGYLNGEDYLATKFTSAGEPIDPC